MFDFTKLREVTVNNSAFAKSFFQSIFDTIAIDIPKAKQSVFCDHVEFKFNKNCLPAEADPFGVFHEYSLEVEVEYFFNGELRVHFCAEYPEDANDDVIFKHEAFEESLECALTSNGFEYHGDTFEYVININSNKT
ncbi:MAG: hypothetical protein J6C46_00765 [Clostridia bacterium]|nr:hypothetical protein [Clostridia bacterium]